MTKGNNNEEKEEYCICRQPQNDKWMIQCDSCHEWFHGDCIGIHEEEGELLDKFLCDKCNIEQAKEETKEEVFFKINLDTVDHIIID